MKDVGILDIVAETDGTPVIDGYCDPDGIIDSFIITGVLIEKLGCDDGAISGIIVGDFDSQHEHCTFGRSPLLSAESRSVSRPSLHNLIGTDPVRSFSSNFNSTFDYFEIYQ